MPRIFLDSKPTDLKRISLIVLILILLAGCIFFGFEYFIIQKELRQTQTAVKTQQINEKILDFSKLFIDKVLRAETEVDFETRLKLENAVRDLGDVEILAQWNKFVESKTETEAQSEVKSLLEMLVAKIKVQ